MARHVALFAGADSNGDPGFWVSNGTAAGTSELTTISGAFAGGLQPRDLTVFNSEVVFNGRDTATSFGL